MRFDLRVVAEGVENEAQRDLIAAEGGYSYQGFYKSQPLSGKEMAQLIIAAKREDTVVDQPIRLSLPCARLGRSFDDIRPTPGQLEQSVEAAIADHPRRV